MPITAVNAQFTLAKDLINNNYRTDVSLLSKTFLVENFVLNGSTTLLASALTNSSAAMYIRDTNKVWILHNGSALFDEYEAGDFTTIIRTITVTGLSGTDTEGSAWMGYNSVDDRYEFAITDESAGAYRAAIVQLTLSQLVGSIDLSIGNIQELTLAATAADNNSGPEGIAYDKFNDVFYVVGEGQQVSTPRRFFRFQRPIIRNVDYTYTDAELTVTEPFDPEVVFASYGATGALFDLSDCFFHEGTGNIIIMSDTGARLLQCDITSGSVISEIALPAGNQWEGLTLIGDDGICITEPNSYQLYNYVAP